MDAKQYIALLNFYGEQFLDMTALLASFANLELVNMKLAANYKCTAFLFSDLYEPSNKMKYIIKYLVGR